MGLSYQKSTVRGNISRLTRIRIFVLTAQIVSVLLAYLYDLLILPWYYLSLTLGTSVLLCFFTILRLKTKWPIIELEYLLQLVCDVLIHSVLLFFSGGSINPFVSYYLVPLTISAVTLRWTLSLFLALLALALYTLLLKNSYPIDTIVFFRERLHIYGMWLSFALSAGIIVFFAGRAAAELRNQEKIRNTRQEDILRDEQLLAVAANAAGAAHELGTPLSTMSIIIEDLAPNSYFKEDLDTLKSQVKLCKQILHQLVRSAEANLRLEIEIQKVTTWLRKIIDRWHLMRPEVSYHYNILGDLSITPEFSPAPDLAHAMLSLLNNSADACPENLRIILEWNRTGIKISIYDYGKGVPLSIFEEIGKPFITTKGKGLGLGFFLSKASVTRMGGSVKLYTYKDKGSVTELRLPNSCYTGDRYSG